MVVAAFLVSLLALSISALNYYWSHHHKSRKLYVIPSFSSEFFSSKSFQVIILNAGNTDIVLTGYSLGIKTKAGNGTLGRDSDSLAFDPSFKGLLNPGNATIATAKLHPIYKNNMVSSCGISSKENEHNLFYELSISWCDSSGNRYRSMVPVDNVTVNDEGSICGFEETEKAEINLYNHAKCT